MDVNGDENHEIGILSPLQRSRVRLQAHIGIALADYYLENYAEALQGFESALEEIEVDENLKDDGERGTGKLRSQLFWLRSFGPWKEKMKETLLELSCWIGECGERRANTL